MHIEVYTGSLFNQELHPVFPETTGESTKQSTQDYLQHHQISDLDPLKTHTSFGSAQNTTKNVDLVELSGVQALKNPNPLKDVEAFVVLVVAVLF